MTAINDRDYVLGTHDEEVERLGLQHAVWRPRALEAWRQARFTRGQTIIDVGSGPGYASSDLASIVGAEGRVIACDRSRRFLDVLTARRDAMRLSQIEVHELDLDEDAIPAANADGAWARWVFAFVKNPQALLAKVHRALRPGGVFVIHEYLDYTTWKVMPPSAAFEAFVLTVMRSWRESGGEPDIGRTLPLWMEELGFSVQMKPIMDVYRPNDFGWHWPKAFLEVGLDRLVDLGFLTSEDRVAVREAASAPERVGGFMVMPSVMEIIATKQ
jgi:SAM-dependent methyltransferase